MRLISVAAVDPGAVDRRRRRRRLQAGAFGRRVRQNALDAGRRGAGVRVGRDVEAEPVGVEHVERRRRSATATRMFVDRAGADHDQALPGGLAPVGVGRERVVELLQAALGEAGARGDSSALSSRSAARSASSSLVVASLLESSASESRSTGSARLSSSRHGRAEVELRVAPAGPEHARDLHVAAERDRADAVLDAVPGRLRHGAAGSRCRSAVAACRVSQGHEEVARLVHEYEQGQPEDGDRRRSQAPILATSCSAARLAAGVGLDQRLEIAGRRGVGARQRLARSPRRSPGREAARPGRPRPRPRWPR